MSPEGHLDGGDGRPHRRGARHHRGGGHGGQRRGGGLHQLAESQREQFRPDGPGHGEGRGGAAAQGPPVAPLGPEDARGEDRRGAEAEQRRRSLDGAAAALSRRHRGRRAGRARRQAEGEDVARPQQQGRGEYRRSWNVRVRLGLSRQASGDGSTSQLSNQHS